MSDPEKTGADIDGDLGQAIYIEGLPFPIHLPPGTSVDDVTPEMIEQLIRELIGDKIKMQPRGRKKLQHINTIEEIVALIQQSNKILVLSGAGISCSAGIPDFRSEGSGLYAKLKKRFDLDDPTAMFDMRHLLTQPQLFYHFAHELWPGFDDVVQFYPTATHYFIRALESRNKLLRNYTQNIDTLEMRAGIEKVITCHGSFMTASCVNCEFQIPGVEIERHIMLRTLPLCPYCQPRKSDLLYTKRDINDINPPNDTTLTSTALESHNRAMTSIDEEKQVQQSSSSAVPTLVLSEHKPIKTESATHDCVSIRIPKLLSVYIDNNVAALKRFDSSVVEWKWEPMEPSDKFRVLTITSDDPMALTNVESAVFNFVQNIASFGMFKPDIVFFNEPLSDDYHSTLESDVAATDCVIIIGTSLQVQPVANIPKQVPSDVPIILINRESVGWPNEFDSYLLGDCDNICETLLHLLQYDILQPQLAPQMNRAASNNSLQRLMGASSSSLASVVSYCPEKEFPQLFAHPHVFAMHKIQPISVQTRKPTLMTFDYVQPNYYLFANGVLPSDITPPTTTDANQGDAIVTDSVAVEGNDEDTDMLLIE